MGWAMGHLIHLVLAVLLVKVDLAQCRTSIGICFFLFLAELMRFSRLYIFGWI